MAVQVAGQDIGVTSLQTAAPYSFSLIVPPNVVGTKNLTAIGITGSEEIVTSTAVTIDVESNLSVSQLASSLNQVQFDYAGEQLPLRFTANLSNGSTLDVTNSSQTQYSSGNAAVATVDSTGIVTAVGAGTTTLTATYGGQSVSVQAVVPAKVKGDLDGDGKVTVNDLLVLQAFLGYTPVGTFDARDLNGDGKIDSSDLQILMSLCGSPCSGANSSFSLIASPASNTVQAGKGVNYNLTITPSSSSTGTVSLSCSGLPSEASCTFSPTSVSLSNSPASVQMSIMTSAASASLLKRQFWYAVGIPLTGLVLLAPATKRRNRLTFLVSMLLLCSMILAGCGGGGGASGSNGGNPGTPPGTYTVTVTASAGLVQQSSPVTLIVQ
jgi:hypothetical protein